MCFSAEASFSASIVLGVVGFVAVKKTQLRSQLAFACIPFLFAFQQFAEGFLWLSLTNKDFAFLETISTYLFLIISHIVWPIWAPLSILILEKEAKRKRILSIILGIGITLSIYLTFCFFFYNVHAEISNHHVEYTLEFPHSKLVYWITGLFYFIPTVVSTFISSAKRMQLLGMAILLSCLLTRLITIKYFISLWCFFAAIISIFILLIIIKLRKSTKWWEWLNRMRF